MGAPMLVKSAQRALEILECFEAVKRPMGVAELAQRLGYPLSSTSRLVDTLIRIGYLNLDSASRKFAPTLGVAMLGDWVVSGSPALAGIKKLVQDAQRLTGGTAVLSTRNDIDIQYVHVIRGAATNFKSRGPSIGTRRPLVRGAAGVMLLSTLPDASVALIARKVRAVRGERIDVGELMREVADARRRGYVWDARSVYPDVGTVALRLPVDDVFGKPLVLAISGAADWIEADHRRIVGVLRRLLGRFAGRSG